MRSAPDAAEFLTDYAQQLLRDCVPFNGEVETVLLGDAIALLECALLLGTYARNAPAPQAAPPPREPGGDWAKTLQSEHMHRAHGMVFGMTMADLVAFEDAEKAAHVAGQVDTHA